MFANINHFFKDFSSFIGLKLAEMTNCITLHFIFYYGSLVVTCLTSGCTLYTDITLLALFAPGYTRLPPCVLFCIHYSCLLWHIQSQIQGRKMVSMQLMCRRLHFSLPPPLLLLNLGHCVATNVRCGDRKGRKRMTMTVIYWQIFFNTKDQLLRIVILFFYFHILTLRGNFRVTLTNFLLRYDFGWNKWESSLFGLKA